jgi:hypothetical protein
MRAAESFQLIPMKITALIPTEIDVAKLHIEAAVNYDEEEITSDFPGRTGNLWRATIDVDTGKIEDWPGRVEKMHLTVKDEGSYYLFDRDGKCVGNRQANYVPHGIVPGSYGDTIELDICADGTVKNFRRNPDFSEFFQVA